MSLISTINTIILARVGQSLRDLRKQRGLSQMQLPDDTLALSLNRHRNLFMARLDLVEFGRSRCRVDNPKRRIARLLD